MIADRIAEVKKQLPEDVVLVAVSKTKPIADIEAAYAAGQRVFGENRVQEMQEKAERLPKDIQWHMIGHVQGNKIKYFAPFVSMVHGMDKPKRFAELNKEAAKNKRVIDCLIQIHIAKEESKFGFDYQEAEAFLQTDLPAKYPNLRVRGLMGMATFTDNQAQVKSEFEGLRHFFDKIKGKAILSDFNLLSMGMSGDYELAVEAGSTMVRIGSALFGARH